MRRREWIRSVASGAAAGAMAAAVRGDVPDHLWQGYDFGAGPAVPLETDGAYPIKIKNHGDPDWRQGV